MGIPREFVFRWRCRSGVLVIRSEVGCLVGVPWVFVVGLVRSEQRLAFSGGDLVMHVSDVGGGGRVRQGRFGGAATTKIWNGVGLRLCLIWANFFQFGLDLDPVYGLSSWYRFCVSVLCRLVLCCFTVVL